MFSCGHPARYAPGDGAGKPGRRRQCAGQGGVIPSDPLFVSEPNPLSLSFPLVDVAISRALAEPLRSNLSRAAPPLCTPWVVAEPPFCNFRVDSRARAHERAGHTVQLQAEKGATGHNLQVARFLPFYLSLSSHVLAVRCRSERGGGRLLPVRQDLGIPPCSTQRTRARAKVGYATQANVVCAQYT